jgi:hypothetical protein
MMSDPLFYKLLLVGLLWLCLMLHVVWPDDRATSGHQTSLPAKAPRKRSKASTPLPGLTHKPPCAACEHATASRPQAPCAPPPIISTRGRRREVNTSCHCCPAPACRYGGWLGLGNITSNGHPNGGPWRQLHCTSCGGYLQETHGTPLHGQRVAPEKLVWAVGALAAGWGIRAGARGFEVDPNTVLAWLVAGADHAVAFSQYCLHAVRGVPGQLDALFARLSAVKAGEVSEPVAAGAQPRRPPASHGATRGPSGGPGAGTGLRTTFPDRWLQGVYDRAAHPWRAVGATAAAPRHRSGSPAPLDAAARAAGCPGGEDQAAPALGRRQAPCGVRHA